MKWLLTFPIYVIGFPLFCQISNHYLIASQGDFEIGISMSLSWSIGDLVTESVLLEDKIVTQGFQQPVISVKTENSPTANDLLITIFPNPSNNDITLEINNENQEYTMDLFDLSGKILWTGKSTSSREVISLYELPAAQYLFRIILTDSKRSKTFQITKFQ